MFQGIPIFVGVLAFFASLQLCLYANKQTKSAMSAQTFLIYLLSLMYFVLTCIFVGLYVSELLA